MERDTAFGLAVANIRFGPGTTREVGMELADRDVRRVMLVTDPHLVEQPVWFLHRPYTIRRSTMLVLSCSRSWMIWM